MYQTDVLMSGQYFGCSLKLWMIVVSINGKEEQCNASVDEILVAVLIK